MNIPEKIKNVLSSERWYHATTLPNYYNILRHGVLVDYNKGRELDYGYGFYLTPTFEMAERYISRLNLDGETLVVMEFELCPIDWFEKDEEYTTTIFPKFDTHFAEFVFLNRESGRKGIQSHVFDAVYGVMSDSAPTLLLAQYRAGEITREEVITKLQKSNSMKQLSLHNQNLCDNMFLKRAYVYDEAEQTRKELDIRE